MQSQARANLNGAKELVRNEFESQGVGSGQLLDSARTKVKVAEATVELAQPTRVTLAHARDDSKLRRRRRGAAARPAPPRPNRPEWAAWSAVLGAAANPLRYSVASRMVAKGEMIRQMPVTNAYRLVLDHVLKLRHGAGEVQAGCAGRAGSGGASRPTEPGIRRHGRACNPTVDTVNRITVEIEVPNYARLLSAAASRGGNLHTNRFRHSHSAA